MVFDTSNPSVSVDQDSTEEEISRYIHLLTVPICLIAAIGGIVVFFAGGQGLGLGSFSYGVSSAILILVWKWKKDSRLWCHCYILTWVLFSTFVATLSGGLMSPVIFVYIPVPLIALVFLTPGEGLFWTFVLLFLTGALLASHLMGWIEVGTTPEKIQTIGNSIFLISGLMAVWVIGNTFRTKANEKEKRLAVEIEKRSQAEEDLVRQKKSISDSNRELERFAVVAAHDLQEPLRMIGSYVQLLARKYKGKLDSEADEYIHYAVEGATKMKGQMNALLEYSRAGTIKTLRKEVGLKKIIDSVKVNLRLAIQEANAQIEVEDLVPEFFGNENQLVSIFQSLIDNAIKFRAHRNLKIKISSQYRGEEVIFFVEDNGIGIDPKHQATIFDIFQRLQSREDYEGLGVGLSIAKKLVENHGGKIWVQSTVGIGSKFFFTIRNNPPENMQSSVGERRKEAGHE